MSENEWQAHTITIEGPGYCHIVTSKIVERVTRICIWHKVKFGWDMRNADRIIVKLAEMPETDLMKISRMITDVLNLYIQDSQTYPIITRIDREQNNERSV